MRRGGAHRHAVELAHKHLLQVLIVGCGQRDIDGSAFAFEVGVRLAPQRTVGRDAARDVEAGCHCGWVINIKLAHAHHILAFYRGFHLQLARQSRRQGGDDHACEQ